MSALELKRISHEGIGGALAKAERYRLLNEPSDAESICRDILAIDPDHQEALVVLLLALTDQFDSAVESTCREAREILPLIRDEYARTYYAGIIEERRGRAYVEQNKPGRRASAYESLVSAMRAFERAEQLRPAGNDDAVLRWNACARVLMKHPELAPSSDDQFETFLE